MKKQVMKMMDILLTNQAKSNVQPYNDEVVLKCFVSDDGMSMAFYREDDEESLLVNLQRGVEETPENKETYFVIENDGIYDYDTREQITLDELFDKILDFSNEGFVKKRINLDDFAKNISIKYGKKLYTSKGTYSVRTVRAIAKECGVSNEMLSFIFTDDTYGDDLHIVDGWWDRYETGQSVEETLAITNYIIACKDRFNNY